MDIQAITSAIKFGNLSNADINAVADAIKFARAQLTQKNKRAFSVGDTVKFRNSRTGGITVGTIKKINIKYILINETRANSLVNSVWRVPANMLEVA